MGVPLPDLAEVPRGGSSRTRTDSRRGVQGHWLSPQVRGETAERASAGASTAEASFAWSDVREGRRSGTPPRVGGGRRNFASATAAPPIARRRRRGASPGPRETRCSRRRQFEDVPPLVFERPLEVAAAALDPDLDDVEHLAPLDVAEVDEGVRLPRPGVPRRARLSRCVEEVLRLHLAREAIAVEREEPRRGAGPLLAEVIEAALESGVASGRRLPFELTRERSGDAESPLDLAGPDRLEASGVLAGDCRRRPAVGASAAQVDVRHGLETPAAVLLEVREVDALRARQLAEERLARRLLDPPFDEPRFEAGEPFRELRASSLRKEEYPVAAPPDRRRSATSSKRPAWTLTGRPRTRSAPARSGTTASGRDVAGCPTASSRTAGSLLRSGRGRE